MFVTKKSVITTASKCIKQQFKAPVKKIRWWLFGGRRKRICLILQRFLKLFTTWKDCKEELELGNNTILFLTDTVQWITANLQLSPQGFLVPILLTSEDEMLNRPMSHVSVLNCVAQWLAQQEKAKRRKSKTNMMKLITGY